MNQLYSDYASSTPVDPKVLRAMTPYFLEDFGNASSDTHAFGWKAKAAVNKARKTIATHIGAEDNELIFTSGATESMNIAIKGVFERFKKVGKHIITAKTEHSCSLDTIRYLEEHCEAKVTYLDTDQNGQINLSELESAIRPDTILINLMWVNNETGIIQDVEKIGQIAIKHNIQFACDGTQALGKIKINVKECNIALLAISSHKIYGPKGVGALYMSRKNPRANISKTLHGGEQEKNVRPGTFNTPAIVGFSAAVELLNESDETQRMKILNHKLVRFFTKDIFDIIGTPTTRCDHILNVMVKNTDAGKLLKLNPNVAFSLGSACTSSDAKPSHVLLGMNFSLHQSKSAFRLSIGRYTTDKDVDHFISSFKWK